MSPSIDMRVALTNPITLDRFNVLRRKQDVNTAGRVVITTTLFNNVRGVVTPSLSMKDLQRMTNAQIQSKAIAIVTRFALRGETEDAGQQDFQPDIVFWHGNNFLIILVEDYSNYAAGFVRAIGVMMDIQAVPIVTGGSSSGSGPTPPVILVRHQPIESSDGVKTSFTFPGLPALGQYNLYWNGLLQDQYSQLGDEITLSAPPEPGADIFTQGY